MNRIHYDFVSFEEDKVQEWLEKAGKFTKDLDEVIERVKFQ